MEIVENEDDLRPTCCKVKASPDHLALLTLTSLGKSAKSRYFRRRNVLIPGIMEHIERRCSGDLMAVYPPQTCLV